MSGAGVGHLHRGYRSGRCVSAHTSLYKANKGLTKSLWVPYAFLICNALVSTLDAHGGYELQGRSAMAAILMAVVLGVASAFFLFVLIQFRREGMGSGRGGEKHLRGMPFCMACAQGWPHELSEADEFPIPSSHRRVVTMNPLADECWRNERDSRAESSR